ncbi:UNVERIFIED_CONTAM: hypothetical protein Slati_0923800 [Sesamum latifolium]|uniref:DUF4283 domain-containing protein n=1 Tax=Sesamum latifolium TaxID=2727402 RepID=A0AAW2XU50_9LAMI
MRVFKWTPTFNPKEESPIVPVWVRLPELPIQFFEREVLFSIAQLGTPLRTDVSTATLVRPSVARVCVEVNLLEPLQIEVGLSFETEVVIQPVVYERLPKYCGVCKHLGHDEISYYEKNKLKASVQPAPVPALSHEDLRVKLDAQRSQRELNARIEGKRVVINDSTCGEKGDTDAMHGEVIPTIRDEEQLADLGKQETTKPSHGMPSDAKGDKDEMHDDVPETVMEELVQAPDSGDVGMKGYVHTTLGDGHQVIVDLVARSQDPEMPAAVIQELGDTNAVLEISDDVQEVGSRLVDEQTEVRTTVVDLAAVITHDVLPGCVENTSV